MTRWWTAAALLACYVLATNAAPQTVSCMSGIPCGRMCAPLGGTCIHNQCYDSLGYPALCYAPMANTYSNAYTGGGSWWQPLFNPFFSFRPWQPIMQQPMQQPFMQPMVFPAMNDCGGRGPCPAGAFCDAAGVCREDTCENQFQFGCPKDTGSLQRVTCLRNSGFNRCFESTSGGFRCSKGPAGGSVACASSGFSSSSATMTQNFKDGAAAGSITASGYTTSSSSSVAPEQAVNAGGADAAAAESTAAAATGAAASEGSASAQQTVEQPGDQQGAAANVSTAAVADAEQQQQGKRPRGQRAAKAAAAAAATSASEAPENTATKQFITQGVPSNQQVTVSPDGQTVTVTNMANDGSAVAAGSASGDQRSVTTMTIPGGSSVTSTSFSGPGTGPATAAAASSSSGGQPLYMPFQGGAANAANAVWMGPMNQPGFTQSISANPAAAAGGGSLISSSQQKGVMSAVASSGGMSYCCMRALWTSVIAVLVAVLVSVW